MTHTHVCPKCGKPESSFGDNFCGPCEQAYHEEQEQAKENEIAQLKTEIQECGCLDRIEEHCSECSRKYAHILDLEGKHDQAVAYLNA